MKKALIVSLLLLMACMVFAQKPARLKIIYFHSERRCPTCISIEDNTRKTLDKYFKAQVKDGTITLEVLNIEDSRNQALVEKYEADGSSLFLTRVSGSKESKTDFTNFAFSYSRNKPEKFIAGLKAEIEKNLK